MSKIKRLAGQTVLYGLGSIIPRFLNFLLVPLHTGTFSHYFVGFDPTDYGIITWLFSYTAIINTVYLFGMETAYFRFSTKPGANEKNVYNITQTVVISISLVLSVVVILFAQPIADYLDIPEKSNLIIWLAMIMVLDAVVAIPFARLRLQNKALLFVSGKLANILIVVALNIYFLVIVYEPSSKMGVDFVLLANLIANAFYILFFAKSLLSWRPAYDSSITPTVLSYGYPIMLTGLAGMTNEMFSRIMLKAWLPAGFYPGQSANYALGVFGASYKFSVIMNLAITAFRYAAEPFFFSNAVDKNSPELFSRINHYFVIVCCFILLGVSINLDILKHFLGRPEYWQGLNIVPILLLAYLFIGVYYNVSVWFKLTDRTYFGTLITVGGVLITVVGNYTLIPIAGYLGSSWAALLCNFTMMTACYFLGQKFFAIPYNVGTALSYIGLTTLLVYAVLAIRIEDQLLASGFHLLVIVGYTAVVWLVERRKFSFASH
jgi:O-antigen/teichoic acid export membrane protein